jgi:Ni/Co efflux regulator RcnB
MCIQLAIPRSARRGVTERDAARQCGERAIGDSIGCRDLIVNARDFANRLKAGKGVAMSLFRARLSALAITTIFTMGLQSFAWAQEEHHEGQGQRPPPPPHPGGPPPKFVPPHGPVVGPHPGAVVVHPGGPAVVVTGPRFIYRGHEIERIHITPFVYPPGWAYRRWAVGAVLPPLFLVRDYWYADWAGLGLAPPEPGFQWVRYGPDLLLVNVTTGQVVDVAYGVFY